MNPTMQGPNNPSATQYGRYKGGLLGMAGGNPNMNLAQTLYGMWKQHQQSKMDQQMQSGMDRNVATSSGAPAAPSQAPPDDSGGYGGASGSTPDASAVGNDGEEAFASGGIVTQPTRAILGEKGPEAVIPLTDQPGQKVSTNMIGPIHTRYRRPGGPNALKTVSPIKNDIPLLPNKNVR